MNDLSDTPSAPRLDICSCTRSALSHSPVSDWPALSKCPSLWRRYRQRDWHVKEMVLVCRLRVQLMAWKMWALHLAAAGAGAAAAQLEHERWSAIPRNRLCRVLSRASVPQHKTYHVQHNRMHPQSAGTRHSSSPFCRLHVRQERCFLFWRQVVKVSPPTHVCTVFQRAMQTMDAWGNTAFARPARRRIIVECAGT